MSKHLIESNNFVNSAFFKKIILTKKPHPLELSRWGFELIYLIKI